MFLLLISRFVMSLSTVRAGRALQPQAGTELDFTSSPAILLPIEPTSPLGEGVCVGFLRESLNVWRTKQPDLFPSWAEWPGFRALTMPHALPRLSLQAFALSFFGRLMNSDSARLQGSRAYGQALTELKTNLRNPSTEQMISIIVAITIFKAYEVRSSLRPSLNALLLMSV